MPFDALTIAALKKELTQNISNGRIEKVFQPKKDLIILDVFHPFPRRSSQLLLSINSRFTRGHLVTEKLENPEHPPAFCMLLRKYLQGGRILRFNQPSWERILIIEIENFDPDRGLVVYSLIFEAMGRFSNIILIDNHKTIIDALKRFPEGAKGAREIFPGQKYLAPPVPTGLNPTTLSLDDLKVIIDRSPSDRLIQKIVLQELMGLSTPLTLEVLTRAKIDTEGTAGELKTDDIKLLYETLKYFATLMESGDFTPTLSIDNHGESPVDVFPYRPAHLQRKLLKPADNLSRGLELTIHRQSKNAELNLWQDKIRKVIKSALKKAVKKREKQLAELQKAEDSALYKLYGELLTVNQRNITKGLDRIELENYYEPGQKLTIPLDPSLSPNENAQNYFKRYNKAKKGRIFAGEQVAKTEEEISYLESLDHTLQDLLVPDELTEVEEELHEVGLLKKGKKKRGNSARALISKPHEYISSGGYKILVGRNNKQNDLLTMKIAAPRDLWFHTQKIPGSHVLIRNQGKEVDEKTILEAANLAAFYSKARNSTKVPVDYTEKRYVRKPTGSKPGFVLYENFKTLIIDPDRKKVPEEG